MPRARSRTHSVVQHPIGRGDLRLQFGCQHPGDIDRLLRVTRRRAGLRGVPHDDVASALEMQSGEPDRVRAGLHVRRGVRSKGRRRALRRARRRRGTACHRRQGDDDEQRHKPRAESRHSGESARRAVGRVRGDRETPRTHHEYRNHHLDSTRWDDFHPRDDDIVITTAYKAGTTWTQRIVAALLSRARCPYHAA